MAGVRLAATAVALALATVAPAKPCRVDIAALTARAQFHSVPADTRDGAWVAPDVARGEAHRFRSVLREDGDAAPDFAGHYRIVRIGCGAGAVCPAIVDRRSGRVFFDSALRVAAAPDFDLGDQPVDPLTYRRDSRLLIVIGEPNERQDRAGMSAFRWDGHRLRLLRFVAAARLCAGRVSTR